MIKPNSGIFFLPEGRMTENTDGYSLDLGGKSDPNSERTPDNGAEENDGFFDFNFLSLSFSFFICSVHFATL